MAMAVGRGSAVVAIVLVLCLVFPSDMVDAASFTVGGAGGWTFNVVGWPKGKRFKAGDVLVFNYDPKAHNVVAVNKAGYDGCTKSRGAKVYQSGKDRIKLVKGKNYFICSFPGHCQSGMKIAVTAT